VLSRTSYVPGELEMSPWRDMMRMRMIAPVKNLKARRGRGESGVGAYSLQTGSTNKGGCRIRNTMRT
jgi:hypothetical protein